MKKLTSLLIVLVLVVGAVFALTACDQTDKDAPTTVMNVSLNPEVEFVLDGNGKVVTVNALNEDGNLIITATVFEGKTAEEAAELFVQVSHEMGFLVSGNAQIKNNDIEITISGEQKDVEELYNNVKESIQEYFTLENIVAEIAALETMTREQMEALVAQAQPYIDQAKLQALSHMELVEELYASRKETCEMYSQELKNAYYNAKAAAMDTTKIQALKEQMGSKFNFVLEGLFDAYTDAVAKIEDARMQYLVSAESDYQVKLAEFRAKKIEFLQKRQELAQKEDITEAEINVLNGLENAVNFIEDALVSIGELANKTLDTLKAGMTKAYNALVSAIESAQVKIADHMDAIMKAQEEQVPVFAAEFEAGYAQAVEQAKADWEAMKLQLQGQPDAE